MTGHLLGAAGALEAVCHDPSRSTTGSPRRRSTSTTSTPRSRSTSSRGEHRKLPDGDIAALNNSFGFGGHNVALVFKSV